MREWFTLSDPGMKEALFDTPMYGEFARIDEFAHPPNEAIILRFLHRLEKHKFAAKNLVTVNNLLVQHSLLSKTITVVDSMLIAAPQ